MTEKQILKRLQYIQNKFIGVEGYSIYLSYSYKIGSFSYFDIFIHEDGGNIIYHDTYFKTHTDTNNKLKKLKDFADDLLNNKDVRN